MITPKKGYEFVYVGTSGVKIHVQKIVRGVLVKPVCGKRVSNILSIQTISVESANEQGREFCQKCMSHVKEV